MEDEEDLEFLRLAALKSLNSKKIEPIPSRPCNSGNTIEVLGGLPSQQPSNVPTLPQLRPNVAGGECTVSSDILYLNIETNLDHMPEYVPNYPSNHFTRKDDSTLKNVQLSPRSAAFVSENYEILSKRKGTQPGSSSQSQPLPVSVYRKSPNRRSPPAVTTDRRFSRSPVDKKDDTKRTKIQSVSHPRSTVNTLKRYRSRTPQRRMKSKSPLATKRKSSKSPLRFRANVSPNFRSISRSPIRKEGPRSGSSTLKQHISSNKWRKKSTKSSMLSNSNVKSDKSKTGKDLFYWKDNSQESNASNRFRYKSSNQKKDKNLRNSSNNKGNRKQIRESMSDDYRKSNAHNDASKSKQSANHPADGNAVKVTESIDENKREQKIDDDNKSNLSAIDTDSDSSVTNEDGIDLFASDESESENEGRFKLHSSKSERCNTITTVPFSKLGITAAEQDLQKTRSSSRDSSTREPRLTGRSDKSDKGKINSRTSTSSSERSKLKLEVKSSLQLKDRNGKFSVSDIDDNGMKKPIHMRLGAVMKTSKKNWNNEKV